MEDRSTLDNRNLRAPVRGASASAGDSDGYIDATRIAKAIRRQTRLILGCAAIGLAAAVVYVVLAVPRYQAIETILFDEDRAQMLDQVSLVPRTAVSDTAIQGEIEIIKSQALALRVVDALKLDQDADFMNPPASPVGATKQAVQSLVRPVLGLITPAPPSPSAAEDGDDGLWETPKTRAAQLLRNNLEVERIGRSFVLDIKYLGYDPVRATRIAREIGSAYKRFRLESNFEVARGAGDWLTERLGELERKGLSVAQDLERFRLEHKLVSVKGSLLSEQQLSETLTKLIDAEADTAQTQARLRQLEGLVESAAGEVIATATFATETPSDEVIAKLRLDYFEATSRFRDVTGRWGEDHPEAVRLAGRMSEIEQDLLREMRHVTEALRAEHQIALSREASLQSNLDEINLASTRAAGLVGKLHQLEEEATIYREMYQEFLKRYETTRQQQAFPVASVETISSAMVPKGPARPRIGASLALGIVLGGLLGAGMGALRELRERPMRTRADLREALGLPLIGSIALGATERERLKADRLFMRAAHSMRSLFASPPGANCASSIGFAQVLPGSRQVLPRKFAEFLATDGARVMYIETAPGEAGRLETEHPDSVRWSLGVRGTAIYRREVEASGASIDVLFLGPAKPLPDGVPADALPAKLVREVMADARSRYDHIVVSLPPLSANLTANTFARHVDGVVLALAWGQIVPSVARAALDENSAFEDNLVGAVFIDTDLHALRQCVGSGSFEASLLEAR